MKQRDIDGKLNGLDLFGEAIRRKASGPVSERFCFPPFSILDARSGDWQKRKRAWFSVGIKGELGRVAVGNNAFHDLGLNRRRAESSRKIAAAGDGPTVFDPVLCECVYRWFCRPGGYALDPFAGGSVRGVVASILGINYWGVDLSAAQVAANYKQSAEIGLDLPPTWICGDSLTETPVSPAADLIFSCPPYGDLEQYSNDPRDLSVMNWRDFCNGYQEIISRSAERLRENRFACFVVGDFRDKRGHYRNFVSQTIEAFLRSGLSLYNEAILANAIGSASLRVSGQFESGRKLVKTHQNVLVFVKGDWRKAVAYLTSE